MNQKVLPALFAVLGMLVALGAQAGSLHVTCPAQVRCDLNKNCSSLDGAPIAEGWSPNADPLPGTYTFTGAQIVQVAANSYLSTCSYTQPSNNLSITAPNGVQCKPIDGTSWSGNPLYNNCFSLDPVRCVMDCPA